MTDAAPERPILITEDHLDKRVDFERGMPVVPRVTVLLIAIQAAMFALEIAAGALEDNAAIIRLGAQESAAARSGEVWRFWSATMLHGSFDHYIGNAIALFITGMACEHAFGRLQFVFLYFVSALAGSALSMMNLPAGMPAVGASGAIFGLMGAIIAMMVRHRARLFVRDKRVAWVIAFWAGYSIVLGFMTPFVDNLAHIGGFMGGAVLGGLLRPAVLEPGGPSRLSDQILFLSALGGIVAMTIPWIGRMTSHSAPS